MEAKPTRTELLRAGGHLTAIWALAFVQPLLDLLGREPSFFIARGNTPGDILILVIALTLGPPLVLLGIEAVTARFSVRAWRALHLTLLGGISVFLFIRLIGELIAGPDVLIAALAVTLGATVALAALRFDYFRTTLDFLMLAPLVIVALFVFTSPASAVIFPDSGEVETARDSGEDRPVVLVIFDELGTSDLMTREGSINARRYPAFARMAREGTWYINQSTTDIFTPRAVPGILTGKRPPADALPIAADQPRSIFTLLGRDRPLHVMEPVTALCPASLCPDSRPRTGSTDRLHSLWSDLRYVEGRLVLPPGLAGSLPDVAHTFAGFDGPDEHATSRAKRFFTKGLDLHTEPGMYRDFIRNIPASRRGLTVMHMLMPHQPWRFTAGGLRYNTSPISGLTDQDSDKWLVGPDGIAGTQSRMYTQTGFSDRILGMLQRTLRRKGLWDDAIVVVAADHGVSFQGGDVARRRVDPRSAGEVINPPLFIKYPGQRHGGISRVHSTTLDILPTIARAVGAGDGSGFEGVPLQDPVPERPILIQDLLNDDRTISISPQLMEAQRVEAIARANRRLGSGGLDTLGPRSDLIGKPAPPVPADRDSARLDYPGLWGAYRPGTEPVPVFVTGRLEDGTPGTTLAIAVNGRVRGTANAFQFGGATRFGALLTPAALRSGRNEIGIYEVTGDVLVPLGGSD